MMQPLDTVCTLGTTCTTRFGVRNIPVVSIFTYISPNRGHTVYVAHWYDSRHRFYFHDFDRVVNYVQQCLDSDASMIVFDPVVNDYVDIDYDQRRDDNERYLIKRYGHDRAHQLFPNTVRPSTTVSSPYSPPIPY